FDSALDPSDVAIDLVARELSQSRLVRIVDAGSRRLGVVVGRLGDVGYGRQDFGAARPECDRGADVGAALYGLDGLLAKLGGRGLDLVVFLVPPAFQVRGGADAGRALHGNRSARSDDGWGRRFSGRFVRRVRIEGRSRAAARLLDDVGELVGEKAAAFERAG